MRYCAICRESICLPDYVVVGEAWICRECQYRFANALFDQDRLYWEGIVRDRRRGKRVKPARLLEAPT